MHGEPTRALFDWKSWKRQANTGSFSAKSAFKGKAVKNTGRTWSSGTAFG